jgi:hypothetical protein
VKSTLGSNARLKSREKYMSYQTENPLLYKPRDNHDDPPILCTIGLLCLVRKAAPLNEPRNKLWLCAGRQKGLSSNPGTRRPGRDWSPPSLLSSGYQGHFSPGGKAAEA